MDTFGRVVDHDWKPKLSFPWPSSSLCSSEQRCGPLGEGFSLFSFKDLTLRQAEESLVAACLDHEQALLESARELGPHPFRSEMTHELDRLYVWLLNAYISGAYDEQGNRSALAARYPDDAWWIEEDLFDGATAVAAYVCALVAALKATYLAQDKEEVAISAREDAPISTFRYVQRVSQAPPAVSETGWEPPPKRGPPPLAPRVGDVVVE